jgi:hypothetical protein
LNEKVAVDVYAPATFKHYDFLIPITMTVGTAAKLLTQAVETQAQISIGRDNLMLGSLERKTLLDSSKTIFDAGVDEGSELILL